MMGEIVQEPAMMGSLRSELALELLKHIEVALPPEIVNEISNHLGLPHKLVFLSPDRPADDNQWSIGNLLATSKSIKSICDRMLEENYTTIVFSCPKDFSHWAKKSQRGWQHTIELAFSMEDFAEFFGWFRDESPGRFDWLITHGSEAADSLCHKSVDKLVIRVPAFTVHFRGKPPQDTDEDHIATGNDKCTTHGCHRTNVSNLLDSVWNYLVFCRTAQVTGFMDADVAQDFEADIAYHCRGRRETRSFEQRFNRLKTRQTMFHKRYIEQRRAKDLLRAILAVGQGRFSSASDQDEDVLDALYTWTSSEEVRYLHRWGRLEQKCNCALTCCERARKGEWVEQDEKDKTRGRGRDAGDDP